MTLLDKFCRELLCGYPDLGEPTKEDHDAIVYYTYLEEGDRTRSPAQRRRIKAFRRRYLEGKQYKEIAAEEGVGKQRAYQLATRGADIIRFVMRPYFRRLREKTDHRWV